MVEGETGLIVPVDDVVALASAIEHLVASPDLRLRLGGQARTAATRRFNATVNYGKLMALIKSQVVGSVNAADGGSHSIVRR